MTAEAVQVGRVRVRVRAIARSSKFFWGKFSHNRLAVAGVALIVLFGLMALSHPILMEFFWSGSVYNPLTGFDPKVLHPAGPSATHLLGTDNLGRDVLSMLLASSGSTWLLAMTAALSTAVVAMIVGAIGGYYRGWVDFSLAHVSDAFLLLPAPLFLLILGTGNLIDLGPVKFGLIYGVITGLGAGAIVLRSQALKVMAQPFVDATRVAGGRGRHIIFRHLLPHLFPLAALYMMLAVVGAVVADGFAAFLGQTRSLVNWGTMVYYGIEFGANFGSQVPWNALIVPAVALSLFAAAFYLVSVGLREVADPRFKAIRRQ
ncbi:MAG: ABC transporter permease [Acidimicrobiia bacterium]